MPVAEPAEDNLPPLRDVIAAHDLRAKRSLGQNFLFDLNLTRRIARAAGPLEGVSFYEVGPGPGGLTRALLAEGAAQVIAVERDARCIPALEEIAAAYPGRLKIIAGDALELDETTLFPQGGARIAANLPYNVGTAILVKWLTAGARPREEEAGSRQDARPTKDWPPFWQSLTLMFQREVAMRIVAKPGSEAYGRLSVLAQWRTKPKILFDVSPGAFVPPPKITSSIVRLEPLAEPVAPCNLKILERVTQATFGQRRKMLRQSLKSIAPDAEGLARAAGIDPTKRPEELTVEEFAALARAAEIENQKEKPVG